MARWGTRQGKGEGGRKRIETGDRHRGQRGQRIEDDRDGEEGRGGKAEDPCSAASRLSQGGGGQPPHSTPSRFALSCLDLEIYAQFKKPWWVVVGKGQGGGSLPSLSLLLPLPHTITLHNTIITTRQCVAMPTTQAWKAGW